MSNRRRQRPDLVLNGSAAEHASQPLHITTKPAVRAVYGSTPATVHLCLVMVDPADGGDGDVTIAGVYSSKELAEDASNRFMLRHKRNILAIPVDVDQFPSIVAGAITPQPDPPA
jgi:hypothetical protein